MSYTANFFLALAVVLAAIAIVESLALGSLAIWLLYRGHIPGRNIWLTMVRAGNQRMANLFRGSFFLTYPSYRKGKLGMLWKILAVVYYPLVALIVFPVRWVIRVSYDWVKSLLVGAVAGLAAIGWTLYKYVGSLGDLIMSIILLAVAITIVVYVIWMIYQFIRTILDGIQSLWLKWHPLPPPPPKVYACTVNKITVLVRAEDFKTAMTQHNKCVRDGLKMPSDPVIVRPCFVFYHESAKLTEEERSLLAGRLSEMDEITARCTVYERKDIYVPFASPKKKIRQQDRNLFFPVGDAHLTANGAKKEILEGYPSLV